MFVTRVLLFLFVCDLSFADKRCYPAGRFVGFPPLLRSTEVCVQLARDEHGRIDNVACEINKLTNNSSLFFVEFSNPFTGDWPISTDCSTMPCKITEKLDSVKDTSVFFCQVSLYYYEKISSLITAIRIDPNASSFDSITEEMRSPFIELIDHAGSLQENFINVSCISYREETKYIQIVQKNGIGEKVLCIKYEAMSLNYIQPMQEKDNNTELYCKTYAFNILDISEKTKLIMAEDDNDKINKDTEEFLRNSLQKNTLKAVCVDVVPFYEAKALAAANKKLGDTSFEPSLPVRNQPEALTESEYSYAYS